MRVNIAIDWITVTHPDGVSLDPYMPVLVDRLMRGKAEPFKHRTGAYGWRAPRTFIGAFDNGRLLIEVSGALAHAAVPVIAGILPVEGLSVARLDAQATIAVPDADRIIKSTVPNKRYKSSIIVNIWDRGATLYVGAPASDRRLRVYNKTAESGEAPEAGGEWLRVELQCRNRYADRLYRAHLAGALPGTFLEYVRAMADEWIYQLVRDAVDNPNAPVWDEDTEPHDWVARRAKWIGNTVVPSLRRLALHNEEGRVLVASAIRDIMAAVGNYDGESDSQVQGDTV